jgi:plasmid stabilization system protein ParE
LRIAAAADEQIERIDVWWQANRHAAPDLFAQELADALEALTERTTVGVAHCERRGVTVRRLLLRRSRYHVYFSYDEGADIVDVRAVWHAERGQGPSLR